MLFQLTINFAAIVVCFVGAIFGTDLPLTVVQILWVNIIMDTFAAMAMASLPPNPEVMLDKPRPRDEFIITRAMARTIFTCGIVVVAVLLGMMFWWTATAGGMNEVQLTLFFSVFVFLQFWNMFNAKGFETKHSVFTCVRGCREFFLILLAIGIGQVLIVEVGGEVFRTVPLAWRQWAWVIGGTSLIAVGGELVRGVRRRVGRSCRTPDANGKRSRRRCRLLFPDFRLCVLGCRRCRSPWVAEEVSARLLRSAGRRRTGVRCDRRAGAAGRNRRMNPKRDVRLQVRLCEPAKPRGVASGSGGTRPRNANAAGVQGVFRMADNPLQAGGRFVCGSGPGTHRVGAAVVSFRSVRRVGVGIATRPSYKGGRLSDRTSMYGTSPAPANRRD